LGEQRSESREREKSRVGGSRGEYELGKLERS